MSCKLHRKKLVGKLTNIIVKLSQLIELSTGPTKYLLSQQQNTHNLSFYGYLTFK